MANIELDGANKKIKVDSGDLTLDIPGDIILDADGGDVVFADGGTNLLKVTNSSSDVVFQPQVDTKDIVFKQYDGTVVATVEDNATFNVPTGKLAINGTAITSTAAELNILDGVTATAAELNLIDGVTATTAELNILDGVTATAAEINLIDGGTARGTTAIADGDGVLINDAGTMRQTTVETLKTYIGGGITEYDQWRTTADEDISSTGRQYVTSNWERDDNGEFDKIGTGISESSGVFSFPSTGKYLITWHPVVSNRSGSTNRSHVYIFCEISVTANDADYGVRSQSLMCFDDAAGAEYYNSSTNQFLFDVTNTSTHKVKVGFYLGNGVTVQGDSNVQVNSLTFQKLGDT
jgi:hypothetical protein